MANKKKAVSDLTVKYGTTKEAIQETHRIASAGRTPATQIKRRPDGYDYVEEGYMRKKLNDIYPIWSWKLDEVQFLGGEWVWARGTLVIDDHGVTRQYGAAASHRITYKRGVPHTPENIIDISNNIKAAVTDAMKVAINRLCNIADDVYRKQVELPKPLTNTQKEKISKLLLDIDDKTLKTRVVSKIETEAINSMNYKGAIDRLKELLKIKNKKKEKENE